MDEQRWSQMTVSEAPEAATNAVRHAEDGAGPPVAEMPPTSAECRHSGDLLLRGVHLRPLAAMILAAGVGFGLSWFGRG